MFSVSPRKSPLARRHSFKPGNYALLIAGACALLSGCAGLSGLDSASSFQCSAPAGIPCQSVTGVHLNERAGNLPSQRPKSRHPKPDSPAEELSGEGYPATAASSKGSGSSASAVTTTSAASKSLGQEPRPTLGAIRSDPTVIRIWVAPWEDADGDLNDQGYVYLQIDSGRWLIEHNRERIRREFTPSQAAVASRGPAGSPLGAPRLTGAAVAPSGATDSARSKPSQDLLAAIAEGKRRAQLGGGDQDTPGASGTPTGSGTRP